MYVVCVSLCFEVDTIHDNHVFFYARGFFTQLRLRRRRGTEFDTRQAVGDLDVLGFGAWRRFGGYPAVREDGGLEGRVRSQARVSWM